MPADWPGVSAGAPGFSSVDATEVGRTVEDDDVRKSVDQVEEVVVLNVERLETQELLYVDVLVVKVWLVVMLGATAVPPT